MGRGVTASVAASKPAGQGSTPCAPAKHLDVRHLVNSTVETPRSPACPCLPMGQQARSGGPRGTSSNWLERLPCKQMVLGSNPRYSTDPGEAMNVRRSAWLKNAGV